MKKVYLASGWFNEVQEKELTELERILDLRSDWIKLFSPRRIFICPPNASIEIQDKTYFGNLNCIQKSDFLIVNTRDKDIGTIWEAGYATANNKPIVYFCAGLPVNAKFNLMLSRSGIKVCTSFDELIDWLDRVKLNSEILIEEIYSNSIE